MILGVYPAKSAYEGFFQGAILFSPLDCIWRTWAPNKCRFFMWLVAHNKCWTADRLARRGLQHHQKCLLCDQEEETINHLLVSCVFSRQFWFELLQKFGLQILTPQLAEPSFGVWWCQSNEIVAVQDRQGLNSLIILGAWSPWTHQNRCL